MSKRFTIVLLFLGMACTSVLKAQVTAKASMDTSTIMIGQQVTLKLSLSLPGNQSVIWPYMTDTISAGVEVVQASPVDTVFSADKKKMELTQRLRITSFDTGFIKIPSIPFYARGGTDSLNLLASTRELLLTVNTLAVDTNRVFKDVKGVMSLPFNILDYLPWIIGIWLVALAVALIWVYYRKKKNKLPVLQTYKPSLPPHVKALEDLEKLRLAKIWQTGRVKEYYTEMTDILRIYLERKYQVQAMEMTTWDIMENLRYTTIQPDAKTKLHEVLELADLVKFAKEQPLPLQHDQSLNLAVEFIRLSVREEATASDKANNTESTANPS